MSRIIENAESIHANASSRLDICHAVDCKLETSLPETSFGGRGQLTIAQLEKSMTSPNYKAAKPLWK